MITLQVNGEKRSFTEQELTAILENYYNGNADKPIEGEWFEVDPLCINQVFFEIKRENEAQERTRQLILEAFKEVTKNPEKYGRKFKTMMPEKIWETNNWLNVAMKEFEKIASNLGGHIADWVEQSLEWAQRIANGEPWSVICNEKDTAECFRVIKWKDNHVKLIGGSIHDLNLYPAVILDINAYDAFGMLEHTVPLVASYED